MWKTWHRFGGSCVLVMLVCLTAASPARAAKLTWFTDLRKAAEESQRSKRPMLIEISADWCRYCKKMKQSFADDTIVKHVQGCFVPVEIDADKNRRLVESVGAEALPTTVIISHDFRLLKMITGYLPPDQLDRQLGKVCQVNHEVTAPSVPKKMTKTAQKVAVAPKLAFDLYCLVSLFDEHKLQQCTVQHTTTYQGQMLCFASAEHKRKFDADPDRYWPILGGKCLVTAVERNKKVAGKPNWGAIYRERLWFFMDKNSRDKFAASPLDYASAHRR